MINHIIEYLFDRYGQVSVFVLESNTDALKTLDYYPRTSVDTVYNSVEYLVEYAEMAQLPITKKHSIAKYYGIFNNTRKFDRSVTEWNQGPHVEQTWVNLKFHFHVA